MEHTRHHARGNYFAPSWKKIVTALAALALVALLAAFVVGFRLGLPYAIGFAGFYMTYERVHRRAHTHAGTGPYARFLRRHHFWHHFENPKANHGVTSPIWDYVFGTRESPKMIHVPRKLAMEWLVNPATDEVFPDFGADYALRGKAPAAS
jgi:sterol desaturase/sphingolipid hydroxylase (fatty acid hydroxylase superfamily)